MFPSINREYSPEGDFKRRGPTVGTRQSIPAEQDSPILLVSHSWHHLVINPAHYRPTMRCGPVSDTVFFGAENNDVPAIRFSRWPDKNHVSRVISGVMLQVLIVTASGFLAPIGDKGENQDNYNKYERVWPAFQHMLSLTKIVSLTDALIDTRVLPIPRENEAAWVRSASHLVRMLQICFLRYFR